MTEHDLGRVGAARPVRFLRAAVAGAIGVAALAGCGMFGGSSGKDAPPTPPRLEAQLRPIGGSVVTGSVLFSARGDGVSMLVTMRGSPGAQYRVVIHANGNCSSRNGFSAGPPWSPPGASTPLAEQARPFTANGEGSASLTTRVSGISTTGPNSIDGKAVIVHEGTRSSLEAVPDVPNERVACGIIGPLQSLF